MLPLFYLLYRIYASISPSKVEINIYRIASELINNALKHSGATAVDV